MNVAMFWTGGSFYLVLSVVLVFDFVSFSLKKYDTDSCHAELVLFPVLKSSIHWISCILKPQTRVPTFGNIIQITSFCIWPIHFYSFIHFFFWRGCNLKAYRHYITHPPHIHPWLLYPPIFFCFRLLYCFCCFGCLFSCSF